MECTLGIDIGATKTAMALVDDKCRVLASEVFPTSLEGPDANVQLMYDTYKALKSKAAASVPRAIGVGVAGQIEKTTGVILGAPNLRWTNYPLKQAIEAKFQVPTTVLNDVRAAAYGEWHHGAGRGFDDLVCVFVGTGVGAAIVSGGHMLEGATNTAGELGHTIVDMHGGLCSCGSRGCLETVSSGWAMAQRAREVFGSDAMSAKDVFEAYRKGDPKAKGIVEGFTRGLVVGIANVVNMVNPARVVIGGGISVGFPELIAILRKEVPKSSLSAPAAVLEIVPAELGPMAGVIGAASAV